MKRLPAVCLMGLMMMACAGTALQPTQQPPSAETGQAVGTGAQYPAMIEQIRGMQVQLVAQDSHPTVQLTDGKYHASGDPTSPNYADVTLLPQPLALGDLNGDGAQDAAVLLAENYGGTGTFVSVVAMLNSGGKPAQAGAYLIDDRPMVNNLRIDGQKIIVEADIHGPNDPACCATFPVVETLGLTKSGLTLEHLASKTPDGAERSITIESPADGTQIAPGPVQLKGSFTISPFENTLSYHVYDAARKELASGPLMVPAQPGSAGTFDAPIDLSAIPAGSTIRLELSDRSAADGSVLAMDSVELMIK